MTQKDRILQALRLAGQTGIRPEDFLLPDVIDGGKPILRVAARVQDLRKEGHRINTDTSGVTAIYTLVGAVEVMSPVEGAGSAFRDESALVTGGVTPSASTWDEPEVVDEELVWI